MAYPVDKKTNDQEAQAQLGEELNHLKINLSVGGHCRAILTILCSSIVRIDLQCPYIAAFIPEGPVRTKPK
jgi:hypothetical protein